MAFSVLCALSNDSFVIKLQELRDDGSTMSNKTGWEKILWKLASYWWLMSNQGVSAERLGNVVSGI